MKNNCKRFSKTVLIAFVASLSLTFFSVNAANERTARFYSNTSTAEIKAGTSFVQTIGLSSLSGVSKGLETAKFVINYNSTEFDCDVSTATSSIDSDEITVKKSDNKIIIVYIDSSVAQSPISQNGDLIAVKFTAKQTAKAGLYDFYLDVSEAANYIDCEGKEVTPVIEGSAYSVKILAKQIKLMASSSTTAAKDITFSLSSEKTIVKQGETFKIYLSSSDWHNVLYGILAIGSNVGFDNNSFEYVSDSIAPVSPLPYEAYNIKASELEANLAQPNYIKTIFLDNDMASPIPQEGKVYSLTFKVKTDAKNGAYEFKLTGDSTTPCGKGKEPDYNVKSIFQPSRTVYIDNSVTGTVNSSDNVTNPATPLTQNTANIIKEIDKIPDNVTPENKEEVKKVLDEYNKLPEDDKKKIANYDKLEKALADIKKIEDKKNGVILVGAIIIGALILLLGVAVYIILKLRKGKKAT